MLKTAGNPPAAFFQFAFFSIYLYFLIIFIIPLVVMLFLFVAKIGG